MGLTFPDLPRPEDVIEEDRKAVIPQLDHDWLIRVMTAVGMKLRGELKKFLDIPGGKFGIAYDMVGNQMDRHHREQWEYHADAVTDALRLKGWFVQSQRDPGSGLQVIVVSMPERDEAAVIKYKADKEKKSK